MLGSIGGAEGPSLVSNRAAADFVPERCRGATFGPTCGAPGAWKSGPPPERVWDVVDEGCRSMAGSVRWRFFPALRVPTRACSGSALPHRPAAASRLSQSYGADAPPAVLAGPGAASLLQRRLGALAQSRHGRRHSRARRLHAGRMGGKAFHPADLPSVGGGHGRAASRPLRRLVSLALARFLAALFAPAALGLHRLSLRLRSGAGGLCRVDRASRKALAGARRTRLRLRPRNLSRAFARLRPLCGDDRCL